MEGIGKAIHDARAVLYDSAATVQTIGAAIGALAESGALVKPEGQRVMAELSARLAGLGRANSLSRWRIEAEQMTQRHAAERNQLLARARAEIPDTGEPELFPRAAKSEASESAESGRVAGLPSGLYRNPETKAEYRNDSTKPGRRPAWLRLEWRIAE